MKAIKKITSRQGFSAVEMLMAVLILALTLSFIGGGVVVIKDAYLKITLRTEAQTLLSTLITATSNELQSAREIEKYTKPGEPSYWSFYSLERDYRIYFKNKENNIYIKTEVTSEEIPLVTQKVITHGLVPQIEDLNYKDGVFTYNIKIYYKETVYATQEVSVRPINTY